MPHDKLSVKHESVNGNRAGEVLREFSLIKIDEKIFTDVKTEVYNSLKSTSQQRGTP
jgi:hypothetical protein